MTFCQVDESTEFGSEWYTVYELDACSYKDNNTYPAYEACEQNKDAYVPTYKTVHDWIQIVSISKEKQFYCRYT